MMVQTKSAQVGATLGRATLHRQGGFMQVRLANASVELVVVPALGAKMLSLRRLGGREWLWRPPDASALFRNRVGDDFGSGTLCGMDECLPTIGRCVWQGRSQPDHGAVWAAAWRLDRPALDRGEVRTTVRLRDRPLDFARTVSLSGRKVRLDYELINRGVKREAFLWAMHPLLALESDDRLELPAGNRTLQVEHSRPALGRGRGKRSWPKPAPGVRLDRWHLGPRNAWLKYFVAPGRLGRAALANQRTRERLEFRWSLRQNPHLGIWVTRGGWKGFHHCAIEPTNAATDRLDVAANGEGDSAVWLKPGEMRRWWVELRLERPAPPLPARLRVA